MSLTLMRLSYLILGLLAFTAQAHECRELGQANQVGTEASPGRSAYWICIGFAVEDGIRPKAGTTNNLDYFPFFMTKKGHFVSLDVRAGDKVEGTATLYYLNSRFYTIPTDADFGLLDPFFFFKRPGVGYESPFKLTASGEPLVVSHITDFTPVDAEDSVSYRAAEDFVTRLPGMYAWVVKGTIQKQGQRAVSFETKWTCNQPRLPYGPFDASDVKNTLVGAPEGWYDCVRPADESETTNAATRSGLGGSPPITEVLSRF